MPKSLPSPELLRKLLRYEPDTGKLFWREREREFFETDVAHLVWNKKYKDKSAGGLAGNGYLSISIFGQQHLVHRVVYAIYHSNWPIRQIDHINGDRADNRIENLRDVTSSENGKNMKRHSKNTSGITGVYWHKRDKKWQAHIMHERKFIHLGYFDTIDCAIAARKSAEIEYGFHKNHGRRSQP